MTSDLHIYRSANELIKQHGEAADIEAAMRADERLAVGDMEGKPVPTSASTPAPAFGPQRIVRGSYFTGLCNFSVDAPAFEFLIRRHLDTCAALCSLT